MKTQPFKRYVSGILVFLSASPLEFMRNSALAAAASEVLAALAASGVAVAAD